MSQDLQLEGVTVAFAGLTAVSDLTARFPAGVISGLVGPNGAGKTTLLNAICGFAPVSAGRVLLGDTVISGTPADRRAAQGIVRGFQTVRLLERETVLENTLLGCERAPQPPFMAQILGLPAQRRARRRDLAAAHEIIDALGLAGVAGLPVETLPFASRRKTELARLLVVPPKVLLLDEPAAGLDAADRRAMADLLRRLQAAAGFTLILIEHDIELVSLLCEHVVALDQGRLVTQGAPKRVFADPALRLAYFGERDVA